MNNVAVILGAGNSTRMKSEKSKLLIEVGGKSVIRRSVEAFLEAGSFNRIIVVCREFDKTAFAAELPDCVTFVTGGSTRQKSVKNAVSVIDDADYIAIHDGARPLVSAECIKNALDGAAEYGAAAAGVPVKDTIKVVNAEGIVVNTPERSSLIAVQTPQVFSFGEYRKALEKAEADGKDFTDDCQLIEYAGKKVKMTEGEYTNIKITTPEDVSVAENILKSEV